MRRPPALRHAARAHAFGRHIPAGKLFRRVALSVRRQLRDRFGWLGVRLFEAPPVAALPPLPLFKPRTGLLAINEAGLSFSFLGRMHQMARVIDWQALGQGPEHQLLRMNLHYMEYLEAVDDPLFVDLIQQWIGANPPNAAGVWKDSWNAYALSLRVIIWMQQLAARQNLPAAARAGFEASLATQIRFLAGNLETDLGGNHLIKNIKALIWASAFFAGVEAAQWRALGIRLLAVELPVQILADGMHYERSPSYHLQVFADLLECRHVLGRGGVLDDALRRMAQVTADLAHPDGYVAQFNDAGLNMAYAPEECLNVFEHMFGARPQPRKVFGLDQAGYFGLREGDSYFIADCGRIAPDDLPAHGHGDILSFEWSVQGKRIIVDQGVFEYIAGEKRARSRAAAFHNTLCFDGADQADFFGAFRCGRRPDVTLLQFQADESAFVLEGTHNGFAHLPGAPQHSRRFEVSAEQIVIRDRISGKPDRAATISFLFHPEVGVEPSGVGVRINHGNGVIYMTSSAPIAIEPAVWWPDMGHEIPSLRVRLDIECGIAEVATSFFNNAGSLDDDREVS